MGDRDIKKEVKKKKADDAFTYVPSEPYERPVIAQPELIKKKKKSN